MKASLSDLVRQGAPWGMSVREDEGLPAEQVPWAA